MKLRSKLTVLALVSVLILTVFSGCQGRETPEESSESVPSLPSSSSSSSSVASSAPEVVDTVEKIIIDYVDAVAEKKELNSDTVGWLHIPGSIIDDVVLCRTDSNQYYMRLNFEQKKDFNGVYYADKRSIFGTGTREELGVNTCIYGHALTDNEDSPNYSIRFGPLHDFRDPDMAEEMPYLCFTTEKENLVFEIFAVFVANNDNADVPYNRGDIPAAEFCEMVRTEILPRSIYDYGVEIKDTDKFLTLSTCIYVLDNGTSTNYPQTYYRYGIMARLIDNDTPLKKKAEFTINPDPLVDPDGKISSK